MTKKLMLTGALLMIAAPASASWATDWASYRGCGGFGRAIWNLGMITKEFGPMFACGKPD